MSERKTADGYVLTKPQVAALEAIEERLRWPSLHWDTERVHKEAWPHIARAAADAALAADARSTTPEPRVVETVEELRALPNDTAFIDKYGDTGVWQAGVVFYPETSPTDARRCIRKYGPLAILSAVPRRDTHATPATDDGYQVTLNTQTGGITVDKYPPDDSTPATVQSVEALWLRHLDEIAPRGSRPDGDPRWPEAEVRGQVYEAGFKAGVTAATHPHPPAQADDAVVERVAIPDWAREPLDGYDMGAGLSGDVWRDIDEAIARRIVHEDALDHWNDMSDAERDHYRPKHLSGRDHQGIADYVAARLDAYRAALTTINGVDRP